MTDATPKGNIFITTDVLCGYVYQTINGMKPVMLGSGTGMTRYYLQGLIPALARKYQVLVINKISFPPAAAKLCEQMLTSEQSMCKFPYVYAHNLNLQEIAEWIDEVVLSPLNLPLPYVYADIGRSAGIEETIKDHRMMGFANAGMVINSGVGFSQKDYDLIINMTEKPEDILSGFKNESSRFLGV